jgi:large subunit ribosomal protein L4e
MFGATKIWRRWHRKISVNQRRYAVASALAATAVTPLVMARGHRIEQIPELPLVLSDSLNGVAKTKDAIKVLKTFGAYADVQRCADSKKIRCGAGKSRNRRYVIRRGPLIITESLEGISNGFRNLPGVEIVTVDNLNLLDLAPGGHLGRFCIWTQGAFNKLDSLFGTYDTKSELKRGFSLPHSMMTNNDLTRIINSDEIQSIVRAKASSKVLPSKRNPLKNPDVMAGLNPYAATTRARAIAKSNLNKEKRDQVLNARRKERKVRSAFTGRKNAFFRAASGQGELAV